MGIFGTGLGIFGAGLWIFGTGLWIFSEGLGILKRAPPPSSLTNQQAWHRVLSSGSIVFSRAGASCSLERLVIRQANSYAFRWMRSANICAFWQRSGTPATPFRKHLSVPRQNALMLAECINVRHLRSPECINVAGMHKCWRNA